MKRPYSSLQAGTQPSSAVIVQILSYQALHLNQELKPDQICFLLIAALIIGWCWHVIFSTSDIFYSFIIFLILIGNNLWLLLDSSVKQSQGPTNATADATVEVQRYLREEHPMNRRPIRVLATKETSVPPPLPAGTTFLCTPASSLPCERAPKLILFLEKNLQQSSHHLQKHCHIQHKHFYSFVSDIT